MPTGAIPRIELTFLPDVAQISLVRTLIATLYHPIDADAADRLALAAHELLENALKYAAGGPTHLCVAGVADAGARQIEVRVTNRTTSEHVRAASRLVDELASAADAHVVYQRVMRRSAGKLEGSGLGLARISAEGEMAVDCRAEGDRLTVWAVARLGEDL